MTTNLNPHIRYSGIQPQYFPRLHYFARIINADVFVVRDDAQYVRKHKYPNGKNDKSYQAHTPIKQAFGVQLLSIPIQHNQERFLPISKTKLHYDLSWVKDHLFALKIAYGKSKNFKIVFPKIEELLQITYDTLSDLNNATIYWGILTLLEKKISSNTLSLKYVTSVLKKQNVFRLKEVKRGSESQTLKKEKNLTANEKILALLQEAKANEDYCGGTGVAAYIDHEIFNKEGITITIQDWKCTEYPQLFIKQQGFIPNLSILDLLFNVSPSEARRILT